MFALLRPSKLLRDLRSVLGLLFLVLTGWAPSKSIADTGSLLLEWQGGAFFIHQKFSTCGADVYGFLQRYYRGEKQYVVRHRASGELFAFSFSSGDSRVEQVTYTENCREVRLLLSDGTIYHRPLSWKAVDSSASSTQVGSLQEMSVRPRPFEETAIFLKGNDESRRKVHGLRGNQRLLAETSSGNYFYQESVFQKALYHLDLRTSQWARLHDFHPHREVVVEDHIFQSGSEVALPGFLLKVPFSRATVVVVHGGGCWTENSSLSLGRYDHELAFLLGSGYSVFLMSYRGDQTEGMSIPPALRCGEDEVDDVMAALAHVSRHSPNDSVFLMGESYGAYLVNLAIGRFPDLPIRGAISKFGVWSVRQQVSDVGLPSGFRLTERNDPYPFVSNIQAPVLLFHGYGDPAVSFSNASVFLRRAEQYGLQVSSFLPRHIGHGFFHSSTVQWPSIEVWRRRLLSFLEQNTQ